MDLKELGKTPVAGDTPAGSDIRSEEIYETLSAEIEKMSSPSSAGGIDWQKVLDISIDILQNYSKDLLIASYFSMALIKTEGLKGLATGARVYRDMLTTYWETLFPAKSRMRGRRNAVEWWVEKTTSTLDGLDPQPWQKGDIDSLYDDLNAIDSFLQENMEGAPVMAPFFSMIGSRLAEEKKGPAETAPAEKESEPAQPTPVKQKQAPAPVAREYAEAPSGNDPGPMINHAIEYLRSASTILMQNNVIDGLFFRLNRAIAWMTVTAVPPNQGGRTMIEPPDRQIMDTLKNMRQSGDWKNLLMACESRIPEYLFWFDLSRYVVEALEQTGQKNVADEVAGETLLYVKRLPGIERLSFSDGTPLADPETRQWLQEADRKGEDATSAGASGQDFLHVIEQELNNARATAKEGNLTEAIKTLKNGFSEARSVRERFIRQVSFCRFLFHYNQHQLFGPYLQDLLAMIDAHRLEEWEPSLASQAYAVILTGIRSLESKENEEAGKDIFRRLSLLDPVKAMDYI